MFIHHNIKTIKSSGCAFFRKLYHLVLISQNNNLVVFDPFEVYHRLQARMQQILQKRILFTDLKKHKECFAMHHKTNIGHKGIVKIVQLTMPKYLMFLE